MALADDLPGCVRPRQPDSRHRHFGGRTPHNLFEIPGVVSGSTEYPAFPVQHPATANDRDPVMKFFPATARTVFDRSPSQKTACPTSVGIRLYRIPLETAKESSGPRPITNSFTRPPMPRPNACPLLVFRPNNGFQNVTSSTGALSRANVRVSSPPNPASPRQEDQLKSTILPSWIIIRLLADIRRAFATTQRTAPIGDGQTLRDFDCNQQPAAGRGAAG